MALKHIQYRIQKQFQFVHRSSFIVHHIKMSSASYSSSSSASATAPHVSPVLGHKSIRSQHPENDEEMEYELRRREMKRIQEARKRMMMAGGAAGAAGAGGAAGVGAVENGRSSRANACDLDGDEFRIVCEELWVDFKTWVNHHKSVGNCMGKVRATIVSYWMSIWSVLGFLMWFRWYIGSGKEACSYGFGYGVFSFACEVLRYMGELVGALLVMFIGFCVGLLPVIVCLCIYEFKDTFPDPDGDDAADDDVDHLKKE
jgi:hypothetical protein